MCVCHLCLIHSLLMTYWNVLFLLLHCTDAWFSLIWWWTMETAQHKQIFSALSCINIRLVLFKASVKSFLESYDWHAVMLLAHSKWLCQTWMNAHTVHKTHIYTHSEKHNGVQAHDTSSIQTLTVPWVLVGRENDRKQNKWSKCVVVCMVLG